MDDLVAIAKIARPHGIRGEVVADLLTDFPDRFDGLESVVAVLPGDDLQQLDIEGVRFHQSRVLLKFTGLNSIESVEHLRNAEICVRETETVDLEADEFFDWQLEGCSVETENGEVLGSVKELMRTGGTDVLVIAGAEKEYMVPFASAICTEVDIEGRRIVIDPPEGLLEF